jgi:hypothetical protein
MIPQLEQLKKWIDDMAALLVRNENPDPQYYTHFLQEPELALRLVDLIASLPESDMEEERAYYSACIFALDICVAQLQASVETNNKSADKILRRLMAHMAEVITESKHTLSFWLPILNAFYEVHVELSDELKNAYFELASEEDLPSTESEDASHLNSIRDLIEELSDLSAFDIAENFFAQSYAMPADFFMDLILDLYSIEEGQDIALLSFLHPKQEVRDVVVTTYAQIIENITLSSISLSRLQAIKHWYPPTYHRQFSDWIRIQRKKGVVFATDKTSPLMDIKASEVDGMGAQGIFLQLKVKRKNRLCGVLLKQHIGIKDAWITPVILAKDIKRYYRESFDDSVTLRTVDKDYFIQLLNHFLAISVELGNIPDLQLLEMQEELGVHFVPQKLDVNYLLDQLAVQISPFTPDALNSSLQRSKLWAKRKRFTETWYIENTQIDKLVNRYCSYVEGVKICRFAEAMEAVFDLEMELNREDWLFHFLWITLWLKVSARKNEKTWQDSFFIAYSIQQGSPLKSIPIMEEICYQSVVNSIETMQERRTYLYKE